MGPGKETAKTLFFSHTQCRGNAWLAEVGVDNQHSGAVLGQRQGQVKGSTGLPLVRL